MQATQVLFLGQEDSMEKEMAIHSSIFALKNPMDRGAWQATVHGVLRVGCDLATKPPLYIYYIYIYIHTHIYTHAHIYIYTYTKYITPAQLILYSSIDIIVFFFHQWLILLAHGNFNFIWGQDCI